jgi:hypothetical protein
LACGRFGEPLCSDALSPERVFSVLLSFGEAASWGRGRLSRPGGSVIRLPPRIPCSQPRALVARQRRPLQGFVSICRLGRPLASDRTGACWSRSGGLSVAFRTTHALSSALDISLLNTGKAGEVKYIGAVKALYSKTIKRFKCGSSRIMSGIICNLTAATLFLTHSIAVGCATKSSA